MGSIVFNLSEFLLSEILKSVKPKHPPLPLKKFSQPLFFGLARDPPSPLPYRLPLANKGLEANNSFRLPDPSPCTSTRRAQFIVTHHPHCLWGLPAPRHLPLDSSMPSSCCPGGRPGSHSRSAHIFMWARGSNTAGSQQLFAKYVVSALFGFEGIEIGRMAFQLAYLILPATLGAAGS